VLLSNILLYSNNSNHQELILLKSRGSWRKLLYIKINSTNSTIRKFNWCSSLAP